MTLGKIIADFETSLSTQIDIGGVIATLSSATDDDGVALPTGTYFLTVDGANSSKEHFSCTLTGTALTNIKSISRQGVETTGAVRQHRVGASVVLTDFANIKVLVDILTGQQGLDASAILGYASSPGLGLTSLNFATVEYVLSVVTGGTVTFDQQVVGTQIAGETLTVNQIVYFKESDQRWWKADADLTATFSQLQLGITKTAASAGGTISVAISGPVSGFSGLTAGSKYYLSNTAGAISTTAGTYSVFIGWALSTTRLLFSPFYRTNPSQLEKDAMAGTQGAPSSTNKFLTQDNASAATTDQSQTTQNAVIEVGEANATTRKKQVAQSFIPTRTKLRSIRLYKTADTGTFTGTITVEIQTDSSGSPSGSIVPGAQKIIANADWILLPTGEVTFTLPAEVSLTLGTTYWINIFTSTTDNANHPNLGTNSAGGYSSGSVKYNNSTDGWVAVATIDLYFKTYEGINNQVVSTNASGKIPSDFIDYSSLGVVAFQQTIALANTNYGNYITAGTASQDGSILIVLSSGGNNFERYARDTVTGQYFLTASTNSNANGTGYNGMVILGSYVYVFYDAGANMGCYRYNLADLTSETTMTFGTPISTTGSVVNAWTDGTFIYVTSVTAATTTVKLSVSGTNLTQVTTATNAGGSYFNNPFSNSVFDGTYIYTITPNTASYTGFRINKLADPLGVAITSSTDKFVSGFSDISMSNVNNPILIPIDSTRMYVVGFYTSYTAAAAMKRVMFLMPVTKP